MNNPANAKKARSQRSWGYNEIAIYPVEVKGGKQMMPRNYQKCPICGKNRIRVNRSYIYAYIRCDSCKSEGWEHEFPTIFGKKEEQQEKEPLKAAR